MGDNECGDDKPLKRIIKCPVYDKPLKRIIKCPVCNQIATLVAGAGEKRPNGGILFVGEEMETESEYFDGMIDYYHCPNHHDFYISEYMFVVKPEKED